jgi:2-iminobutanoate/2-iminopropanoate deaminase
VIIAFALAAVAASVYLVVVLEILKLRSERAREILRVAGPSLPAGAVDAGVARELETGTFSVIDPATGEFVSEDVAEQTEQVLRNLSEVLKAAGAALENVVKTTVFLADMNDFVAMNEVYGRYFNQNKPARATVQAARLPRDARVEIDCIAMV